MVYIQVFVVSIYDDMIGVKIDQTIPEKNVMSYTKKQKNFYLKGSQNIDLIDFQLIINNNICGEEDVKIITIVTTAIENAVRFGVLHLRI